MQKGCYLARQGSVPSPISAQSYNVFSDVEHLLLMPGGHLSIYYIKGFWREPKAEHCVLFPCQERVSSQPRQLGSMLGGAAKGPVMQQALGLGQQALAKDQTLFELLYEKKPAHSNADYR